MMMVKAILPQDPKQDIRVGLYERFELIEGLSLGGIFHEIKVPNPDKGNSSPYARDSQPDWIEKLKLEMVVPKALVSKVVKIIEDVVAENVKKRVDSTLPDPTPEHLSRIGSANIELIPVRAMYSIRTGQQRTDMGL